ncbi:unnamed protein product [Cuscuta campestris]|uniref:Uncharacterized protein n=1 Tax=Cuscuta campestris TaxID=132261 RepID=A0A484NM87_9ASTE|nr:unnamed protein product [Cuscuta campestris]
MAPANPETWTHEPSIIKEDELREMVVLLGKAFQVHHPDAVGGISLSYNPNPQKYMVMQYHSVENGFRLPLHGEPSPERSKASPAIESGPAGSSSGVQTLGDFTALAIRKPTVALEAVPISAIPGLRRPIPPLSTSLGTQNTTPVAAPGGFELPNPDSLDHQADKLSDQAPLKKPAAQSQPEASNTSPQTATAPPEVEKEVEGQKEPEISSTIEKEVDAQTELETPPLKENEVEEQRATGAPPEMKREPEKQSEPEGQCSTATPPAFNVPIQRKFTPQTYPAFKEGWAGFSRGFASHGTIQANLEKMKESLKEPTIPQARPNLLALNALYSMEQAQQSLLTLTKEYLGGALGNYRAVVALKEKELAARALQQKVDSLEQLAQALQEENARLKENCSTELAAERSRVQSLQEQIAAYQRGTQDLEMQFDRFRAQISILESKASASEDKEAKYEGSRLNELALKHMEARRLTLEKLGKERQTASELQSRMGELEKAIAAHQEEVVTLTARAEALYEEGKFDMQHCIYEAVWSGLPAHRSLDDFISYYGLPLPLSPPDSRRRTILISPNRHQRVLLRIPACFLTVPGRKFLLAVWARPVRKRDAIPTQELPGWSQMGPANRLMHLSGEKLWSNIGNPQPLRSPIAWSFTSFNCIHHFPTILSPFTINGKGWFAAGSSLSDFFTMASKSQSKVFIDLTHSGTSSSSDDDLSASPAQSNDLAGLSPDEFSRLYPAPRLPAPSPPSPPRLPSGG